MNQCDGCIMKLPMRGEVHYRNDYPYMVCTKKRYEQPLPARIALALELDNSEREVSKLKKRVEELELIIERKGEDHEARPDSSVQATERDVHARNDDHAVETGGGSEQGAEEVSEAAASEEPAASEQPAEAKGSVVFRAEQFKIIDSIPAGTYDCTILGEAVHGERVVLLFGKDKRVIAISEGILPECFTRGSDPETSVEFDEWIR